MRTLGKPFQPSTTNAHLWATLAVAAWATFAAAVVADTCEVIYADMAPLLLLVAFTLFASGEAALLHCEVRRRGRPDSAQLDAMARHMYEAGRYDETAGAGRPGGEVVELVPPRGGVGERRAR